MSVVIERLAASVGNEFGPSDWLTVDQDLIGRFARVTGDSQWIHTDPERAARQSPFGTTVAHGMLTLSLAPGLAIRLLALEDVPVVVNYGFNRVRFPAPVPAGTRVRAAIAVSTVERVTGGARVTLAVRFEAEGAPKPVCVAEMLFQIAE